MSYKTNYELYVSNIDLLPRLQSNLYSSSLEGALTADGHPRQMSFFHH
jgi:hypothetical protein